MSHQRQLKEAPLVERVVALVCGALLFAVIGFLVFEALVGPQSAPELSIETGATRRTLSGQYTVELRAYNRGSRSARAVEVEAELALPDGGTAHAALTFDEVPAHASRSGAVLLPDAPGPGQPSVRATSYQHP